MRSFLFVPADSERNLSKCLQSGADAIILDLEDSVTPDRKGAARSNAAAFLGCKTDVGSETRTSPPRPRIYVRINDLQSDLWGTELEAVAGAEPDGIILPKPRSGLDIQTVCSELISLEQNAAAPGAIEIIAIVTETAESLLNMASYIGASPRLTGLCWGGEDLSAVLGAEDNRDTAGRYTSPYLMARTLSLITAAAVEAQAIDSVFTNFRDDDGLKAEAEEAVRDGFTGKLAIHPAQVPIINNVFTPSRAAIEAAKRIVAVFEERRDHGAVSLDGRMIDRPHLIRAQKLLERASLAAGRSNNGRKD
ncbi:MAG: HpcH/HpaI aldolase/citrate lyase family protein [Methyloligellaceae bacterium]